jgi:hypothetical protein
VVEWLEREGLDGLSNLARLEKWDGPFLLALFDVRKESVYSENCSAVGIDEVNQLKLKGRLINLFGAQD